MRACPLIRALSGWDNKFLGQKFCSWEPGMTMVKKILVQAKVSVHLANVCHNIIIMTTQCSIICNLNTISYKGAGKHKCDIITPLLCSTRKEMAIENPIREHLNFAFSPWHVQASCNNFSSICNLDCYIIIIYVANSTEVAIALGGHTVRSGSGNLAHFQTPISRRKGSVDLYIHVYIP